MSADLARAAAADAFSDRAITSVRPRHGWITNEVAEVEFDGGETVYAKVAIDGDAERIARAAAAGSYASEHAAVTVGEVLATGTLGGDRRLPYLVTAPHPGTPMEAAWVGADPDRRRTLCRGHGRTLAELHEAQFEEHGRIVGGDAAELDIATDPWWDVLDATLAGSASALPERFPDAVDVVRDALRTRHDALSDVPARLIHRDHRRNLFREPWGFIDWENALVGDPALDLVRAEADFADRPDVSEPERSRDALYAGYRDRAGSLPAEFAERRPLYRAVTFLTTVFSFEHWAPDRPEPIQELAEWVSDEVRRRSDRVRR